MRIVVDANIVFSALISKGKTEDLLFEDEFELFAPERLFIEFERYKEMILSKTHRTEDEFENLIDIIKTKISLVENIDTEYYMKEAIMCCPDRDDADYFALCLKLKCPLWSNDKMLKSQNVVNVYSTEEMMRMSERR